MDTTAAIDILLVEDSPEDRELVIRSLRKHGLANRLIAVEDGVEALDFIYGRGKYQDGGACHTPKVVLLDLKLPRVDGLEVLRVLKHDARTRSIPVVIVTSSREDPDIQAAYALGANSYVVKPVDFEAFADAMSHLGLYWLLVNQPPK